VVFWMLLQFSRTLRVMRQAAGRPVGSIDNAVMLHAKLAPGMRLLDILPLTRSLGRQLPPGAQPGQENFAWADGAGDEVRVELHGGRLVRCELVRAAGPGTDS
jgi:hypothetical protein